MNLFPRIHRLSVQLANQIAAGEVVERPASVLKELLENSLDSGASNIRVDIEGGGSRLIRVQDDGCGIHRDDMKLALSRHTTSKISSLTDLEQLSSMGFRGEAFASISSVSRCRIVSRVAEMETGYCIEVAGNELQGELSPQPHPVGTTIEVRDLFFNTPARRHFLRSERTEQAHLEDIFKRAALSRFDIGFSLNSVQRTVYKLHVLPGIKGQERRVMQLCGKAFLSHALHLKFETAGMRLWGWIATPDFARSQTDLQYFYLNGRTVRDRLVNHAVRQAYQDRLYQGRHPAYVLFLEMAPEQVDVNVHPMKTEVRFKDEWRVFNVLKSGVSDALSSILDTVPGFDTSFQQPSSTPIGEAPLYGQPQRPPAETIPTNPDQGNMDLKISDFISPVQTNLERAKNYASRLAEAPIDAPETIATENIWQIHKKYIVSEINSGLVIIDQHVAHERVLYEEALEAFESSSMASQTMLFPEVLEFSPDDFDGLLDVLPYLEKIGFKIKKQDESSIRIDALPSEMALGNEREVIREILDNFLKEQKQYSSFQEGLAAMFACKAAIKAGDSLMREEMQELINRLFATEHPYYCPHGRPIIVQMSLDELDGRFERH